MKVIISIDPNFYFVGVKFSTVDESSHSVADWVFHVGSKHPKSLIVRDHRSSRAYARSGHFKLIPVMENQCWYIAEDLAATLENNGFDVDRVDVGGKVVPSFVSVDPALTPESALYRLAKAIATNDRAEVAEMLDFLMAWNAKAADPALGIQKWGEMDGETIDLLDPATIILQPGS